MIEGAFEPDSWAVFPKGLQCAVLEETAHRHVSSRLLCFSLTCKTLLGQVCETQTCHWDKRLYYLTRIYVVQWVDWWSNLCFSFCCWDSPVCLSSHPICRCVWGVMFLKLCLSPSFKGTSALLICHTLQLWTECVLLYYELYVWISFVL